MFVDEITIKAKAGDGGDGVVRWRHEKYKPKAGPAGGNGGNGGDVYALAVADLNRLSKYTGDNVFEAEAGGPGRSLSQFGKNGADIDVALPVGSLITNTETGDSTELTEVGQRIKILSGGRGGFGNEYFKSSTNRAPQESTKGKIGEEAVFIVELQLIADVGLVGKPNAGKSTLLNSLTAAKSKIGDYPFTTLDPHLGKLYEFTIADIPGIIEGAAAGKGLGHKFLRHINRTKMLLMLISLEEGEPKKTYQTIFSELSEYSKSISEKEIWILLTKSDLVNKGDVENAKQSIDEFKNRAIVLSSKSPEDIKSLSDTLVDHLRNQ
ncbi:MAG: GTPase ObgE [Patescibacteria group bacterium]